jgi:hypothetical protein
MIRSVPQGSTAVKGILTLKRHALKAPLALPLQPDLKGCSQFVRSHAVALARAADVFARLPKRAELPRNSRRHAAEVDELVRD